MFSESNICLYGIGGMYAGSKFSLDDGTTLIGRNAQRCAILFQDDTAGVSGVHCQLVPRGGVLEVTDLGSSYGTYLKNGMQLEKNKPYCLENGTIFYLGDKRNRFWVKIK